MMTILFESRNEQDVIRRSKVIADSVSERFKDARGVRRIIGPINAPLYKAEDYFRMIITIKSSDYGVLTGIMDHVRDMGYGSENKDERIDFIFN